MESHFDQLLERVMYDLPEQGPLEFFVHHNTLHQLEENDFFDAVKQASSKYGTRAFLKLSDYERFYQTGRIGAEEFNAALRTFMKKHHIRVSESVFSQVILPSYQEQTLIDDTMLLKWRKTFLMKKPQFFKETVWQDHHIDLDEHICPIAYRFFAAYYDFGAALWKMPRREEGVWSCFKRYYANWAPFQNETSRALGKVLNSIKALSVEDAIQLLLKSLPLDPNAWGEYLFELGYRHKGWMALTISMQKSPEWVKRPEIHPSFKETLAVLLAIEVATLRGVVPMPLRAVPVWMDKPTHSKTFLTKFQRILLQNPLENEALMGSLPALSNLNREEIWHHAYEETLYHRFLNTYQKGLKTEEQKSKTPDYQVFCCIDDREESFRRYLEGLAPNVETFGVAGHFNLGIKYQGYFDKRARALCPVVIKPKKIVREVAVEAPKRNRWFLTILGELQLQSFTNGKRLFRGYFHTLWFGYFSIFPFMLGIAFPTWSAKLNKWVNSHLKGTVKTRLAYKQEEISTGFTLEERTTVVHALLTTAGLTENFAEYIFILGHGSSSINNPHRAAYDCGACGGGHGDANARVLAKMVNEPEVRAELAKKGMIIPEKTVFVRGFHNTCNGEVLFFNLPEPIPKNLEAHIATIKKAAAFDAKERCRRFDDVQPETDEQYFFEHVQGRASNLGQPRPEYGHTTNAFCIVGPRRFSKSLFLDRRSFLVSYRCELDPQGQILRNVLGAVGPVCAGINLEYYFSCIDNEKYGAGTKLPHNITSLIGVMNGHMSDLQIGLPWQMVEIHEPVRLMMCVRCTLPMMESILSEESPFQILVKHRWLELTLHDPETNELFRWVEGKFMPVTQCSLESVPTYSYDDLRFFEFKDHLEFGVLSKSGSTHKNSPFIQKTEEPVQ